MTAESFFGRIHPDDSARMLETRDRYSQDPTMDRFHDELAADAPGRHLPLGGFARPVRP